MPLPIPLAIMAAGAVLFIIDKIKEKEKNLPHVEKPAIKSTPEAKSVPPNETTDETISNLDVGGDSGGGDPETT